MKLEKVPGIGALALQKFHQQKKYKIQDLELQDMESLNNEARLSLQYLDFHPFSRKEIDEVKKKFIKKHFRKWEICGSYRRKKKKMKDIDLLTTNSVLLKQSKDLILIKNGNSRSRFFVRVSKRFVPVDLFVTPLHSWAFALLHFTGSKEFNIKMRKKAQKKGCKLNEKELICNEMFPCNERFPFKTENEIMLFVLGKIVPPEKR